MSLKQQRGVGKKKIKCEVAKTTLFMFGNLAPILLASIRCFVNDLDVVFVTGLRFPNVVTLDL